MFGLLELSRQRLRSSLIDKTFEKCNYCKGSGLILNTDAISEQIIKVIKEKLSQKKDVNVNVTCNTSLAEKLINNKNQEISNLEDKHNSKINFVFDNQFSLHEPLVELDTPKKQNVVQKNNQKNIKKMVRKKTKIKKKTQKNKEVNKKEKKQNIKAVENENNKKNEAKIDNLEIKEAQNENNQDEEKTGWWS